MFFAIIGKITHIEPIAVNLSIRSKKKLVDRFGKGRWRKLKGIATIEYYSGRIVLAELHWYEAHGIGRRGMKIKKEIR